MQLTTGYYATIVKTPTELNALVSCLHSSGSLHSGIHGESIQLGGVVLVQITHFRVLHIVVSKDTNLTKNLTPIPVNKLTGILMNVSR